MKLFFTILIFLITFFSNAQEIRHELKAQLTGIPFSHYGFGYETILNESFSVGANINFTTKIPNQEYFIDEAIAQGINYSDFSITPEIRYYTDPDYDCDGNFWGIYFRYKTVSFQESGDIFEVINNTGDSEYVSGDHEVKHAILGFNYGYKHITDYGLFFESNIGAGYSMSKKINFNNSTAQTYWEENKNFIELIDTQVYHPSIDNFDFRFSVSIGWRFNMD